MKFGARVTRHAENLIPYSKQASVHGLDYQTRPTGTEFKSKQLTKQKAPLIARHFVWCSIVDAFQTSAINAVNDYKLKHLVEVFGLSSTLLTRC